MPFAWDFSTIADHLYEALHSAEQDLRLEQAVYGLDSKDERDLHELLAERLATRYEVAREVHYPGTKGTRLTHRQRCDLVLTAKGFPLKLDSKPPTLFDPPNEVEPGDGLWLEVKRAAQFREGNERHTGYGPQWRQAVVADLLKMAAEPQIRSAGLLLIVFNEGRDVLDKDLELFEDVLATKGVLAGFRQVRSVEITERIGHRLCTAALWPTVQRAEEKVVE